MKRIDADVAGRPAVDGRKQNVAGERGHPDTAEVASFLNASESVRFLSGNEEVAADSSIVEEFAEFLAGGDDDESPTASDPDPIFRARLRRRLWQMQLLIRPPTSHEPH